jgi:hypothetical protein
MQNEMVFILYSKYENEWISYISSTVGEKPGGGARGTACPLKKMNTVVVL